MKGKITQNIGEGAQKTCNSIMSKQEVDVHQAGHSPLGLYAIDSINLVLPPPQIWH